MGGIKHFIGTNKGKPMLRVEVSAFFVGKMGLQR